MIISLDKLRAVRAEEYPQRIVFCSGSFDLTHSAHAFFLEDCKRYGDILVVAVGSDALIAHRKAGRPIIPEQARLKMVDSLKPVDYCFLDTVSTPENPLAVVEYVFKNLRPSAYVFNDETFDIESRRKLCEQYGVNMHIGRRKWEGSPERVISTSSIIEKIGSLDRPSLFANRELSFAKHSSSEADSEFDHFCPKTEQHWFSRRISPFPCPFCGSNGVVG